MIAGMLREKWLTFLFAGGWFVVSLAMAADGMNYFQLPLIVLFLCLPIVLISCLVYSSRHWRRQRWRASLPLAICLALILGGWTLGPVVTELWFLYKLPRYEAVVSEVRNRPMVAGAAPLEIESDVAWRVYAARTVGGALEVQFTTDGGFPVLHRGYLYLEADKLEAGSPFTDEPPWLYTRRVRSHWFRFHD